jgi:hypothetical protein
VSGATLVEVGAVGREGASLIDVGVGVEVVVEQAMSSRPSTSRPTSVTGFLLIIRASSNAL